MLMCVGGGGTTKASLSQLKTRGVVDDVAAAPPAFSLPSNAIVCNSVPIVAMPWNLFWATWPSTESAKLMDTTYLQNSARKSSPGRTCAPLAHCTSPALVCLL